MNREHAETYRIRDTWVRAKLLQHPFRITWLDMVDGLQIPPKTARMWLNEHQKRGKIVGIKARHLSCYCLPMMEAKIREEIKALVEENERRSKSGQNRRYHERRKAGIPPQRPGRINGRPPVAASVWELPQYEWQWVRDER